MKLHRVNDCFGLTLWRSTARHVELWFCFSQVPKHTHPGQNAEIVPLFGWATFYRVVPRGETQSVRINPLRWFRPFTIPADWVHWFVGTPLVFLNINDSGLSASELFHETR
jgi:hypothetical protein